MTVAALIFGPQSDSDALPTFHPRVLGQSLLRYQVRAAQRAGARHIIVFTERVTPDIVTTFDRLASDGIKVELVRNATEAGDHLHPDEMTIIIAPNIVVLPGFLVRLVDSDVPLLVALRDDSGLEALERIDGFTRWAGIAVLKGNLIRETSQSLGEWDFSRTLLRTALQRDIRQDVIDLRHEHAPLIKYVANDADAQRVTQEIMRVSAADTSGLIDRIAWSPLAGLALPATLRATIEPNILVGIAALLSILALASAWLAPLFISVIFFISAGPVIRLAQDMLRVGLRDEGRLRFVIAARVLIGAAILGMMAVRLVDYGIGWGYRILVLWLLVEMARLGRRHPWFVGAGKMPWWCASPDATAIILLVGHFFDHDVLALELAIVYCIVSLGDLTPSRRS